jgi:hypothetical protein
MGDKATMCSTAGRDTTAGFPRRPQRGRRGAGQRVRGKGIALVAVAVAVIAPSGFATIAAASPHWGVIYASWERPNDIGRMQDGGVRFVRWPLFWNFVEPTEDNFNWRLADRIIGAFASRGIRVLPAVYGTPPWAGKRTGTPPLRTQHVRRAWVEFLRRLAERYGPGGEFWTSPTLYPLQHLGGPVLPIKAWQVWNEPNLPQYFSHPSARRYGRLLRISHDALEAQDPGAKIVLAGMPGLADRAAWRFLRRLYDVPGIERDFDAVALHPYAPTIRLLRFEIKRMRAVMREHGDGSSELWVTELGWGSGPRGRTRLDKGLHGQALMLRKSFRLIRRHSGQWNIPHVYWFQWRDPPDGSVECGWCRRAGLIGQGGEPKPSWQAFQQFAVGLP